MNKENEMDFSPVLNGIDKVKAMKASKSKKKPSSSVKPLHFEINQDDSPLKTELVKIINERNYTYADICNYCSFIKGGDYDAGYRLGYNLITGLAKRHTMIDTTLTLIADFLGMDVVFVPKPSIEDPNVKTPDEIAEDSDDDSSNEKGED